MLGQGPTGLLLANLLGAMGVNTRLVETHDDTVQDPRAVSIDDESMRALQAAGLADEIAALSVQGYGSIYRGPSGKAFASVMPTGKDYGFDKRNAFEQPAFEAVLRNALARYPHVTAHFGTEMTAFEQSSDSVQATVCARDAQAQSLHARYMVACDGGRSPVRKMLGIAMQGATFEEPWLVVDLKTTRNRCFHTEVFCDPARPCITLPGPGGIRRYEFKLYPGEAPGAAVQDDFVRGLLAAFGPDRDQALRRVRVYTFHARIAEPLAGRAGFSGWGCSASDTTLRGSGHEQWFCATRIIWPGNLPRRCAWTIPTSCWPVMKLNASRTHGR